jgi:hypothetical protein
MALLPRPPLESSELTGSTELASVVGRSRTTLLPRRPLESSELTGSTEPASVVSGGRMALLPGVFSLGTRLARSRAKEKSHAVRTPQARRDSQGRVGVVCRQGV